MSNGKTAYGSAMNWRPRPTHDGWSWLRPGPAALSAGRRVYEWMCTFLHRSYFIHNGDVSPSIQQRSDHLHVLVLRRPDDGRPAAAVLKLTSTDE